MSQGQGEGREYVYKVLVDQLTREYRYIRARSIVEAERHGIVVILVGAADEVS